MWLDMDEIESFCDGRCTLDVQVEDSLFNSDANSLYTCVCPAQYDDPLDDPPYLPGGGKPPGNCRTTHAAGLDCGTVIIELRCVVASYDHSTTLYQIHSENRRQRF